MTTQSPHPHPRPEPARPAPALSIAGYCSFLLLGWKGLLLPALIRSIEHDLHQTDAAFGFLYFVSALAYGAGSFTGGFLTERAGRRAVLIAAMLLSALGTVWQAVSPSWIWFLLAAVPASWGLGFIDGGVNSLFLDVYRDARGGTMNFLHLFFGLGAFLGPLCLGLIVSSGVSWRVVTAITGASFLPLALVFARVAMPTGRHGSAERATQEAEAMDQSERSLIPFVGLALAIGLYVAAELGVSSWLVRLLSSSSVIVATSVLSAFWGGLSLGRLLSRWVAERLDYYTYTIGCIILASVALVGAVLSPWLAVSAVLFALTGVFFGPIFPMIMALGGDIYPRRLAALGGSLTTAAVVGGMIYPPLMGIMESRIGLSGGMLGAALLGVPMAAAIMLARATAPADTAP